MKKLGKLEKINLREIWSNEEYDFSVWLSKEEKIYEYRKRGAYFNIKTAIIIDSRFVILANKGSKIIF